MDLRPLGRTGLAVSPLGLGTVKFGRDRGVKYPTSFKLPDDAQIDALLALAREEGINLLDTAPAYGESETRLGRALAGRRDDWIIVGKCGEAFEDGRSSYDFSPPALEAQVKTSLQRLRTGHLDVLLLHSDGNDLQVLERDGGLETLLGLKRAGLVRHVGLSAKSVAGARAALERGAEVLMIEFDPDSAEDQALVVEAAASGAGVLLKKALASGHLDRLPGADPVGDAFARALAPPGISSLIVGTIDPAHLRENARAARAAISR